MANERRTINKLQQALNARGCRILFSTSQFYSETQNRPINIYHIKQSLVDEDKTTQVELFSSPSRIQIVLFLRDYWYDLNGWELPTDNPVWNKIREEYKAVHERSH